MYNSIRPYRSLSDICKNGFVAIKTIQKLKFSMTRAQILKRGGLTPQTLWVCPRTTAYMLIG